MTQPAPGESSVGGYKQHDHGMILKTVIIRMKTFALYLVTIQHEIRKVFCVFANDFYGQVTWTEDNARVLQRKYNKSLQKNMSMFIKILHEKQP